MVQNAARKGEPYQPCHCIPSKGQLSGWITTFLYALATSNLAVSIPWPWAMMPSITHWLIQTALWRKAWGCHRTCCAWQEMRVRGWDTIWTRELDCHLNDKQLIHGQIGPTMRVYCAQHHMKNSEGFSPSQSVFYFHLPTLWRGNHELTIKDYLRLLLHCHQNTPPQPKFGQNQEKCYATRKECHANKSLSKTQTQCQHLPWPAHVQKRHTTGQESAPMLTNSGKCYKC